MSGKPVSENIWKEGKDQGRVVTRRCGKGILVTSSVIGAIALAKAMPASQFSTKNVLYPISCLSGSVSMFLIQPELTHTAVRLVDGEKPHIVARPTALLLVL